MSNEVTHYYFLGMMMVKFLLLSILMFGMKGYACEGKKCQKLALEGLIKNDLRGEKLFNLTILVKSKTQLEQFLKLAGNGVRDESMYAKIFQASENVRSCSIVPGLRIECPEGTYKYIGTDVLELNECEKELDRKFSIKAK